jgi:hypothetical protein
MASIGWSKGPAMDDQDLINLQQLLGRGPQPCSLPPLTPDYILLADALAAYGRGSPPTGGPAPAQWADAIDAYGRPPSRDPGQSPQLSDEVYRFPSSGRSDVQSNLLSASIPTSSPSAGGSPSAAAAGSGTAYAMGSPANLDLPWQTMTDANTAPPANPKTQPPRPSSPATPSPVQTTIDQIPGYDETGDNAWRSANDQIFLDAVNRYNTANGYRPGDPGYWTANMLKAQAMVETGGDRSAFMTDPLQVNTKANWADVKAPVAGLTKGQLMTPQTSADAALKWLQYKGWHHNLHGRVDRYRGDYSALSGYNGDATPRSQYTGNSADAGLEQRAWYAKTIPLLAQAAATARASAPASR